MTRDEAMRVMVPYIFDAATARELVEEDLALRLQTTVANDGYFAQVQAIRSWAGTHSRLSTIALPTLIIHGETDELVPPDNARVLARAIPNAALVMLPHASHIFLTDQFDAASEAILSFLDERVPV